MRFGTYYPHSLCIIYSSASYSFLYKNIDDHLSNGYGVIYAAETNPTKVLQHMKKIVERAENHIENGALTIIDRDRFFAAEKTQLDSHKLLNSWHSLILRTKRRSPKFKGILLVSAPSPLFFETRRENGNHDRLVNYERLIGKKFGKGIEMICCYPSKSISKLPFSYLVSVLSSHQCTIHNGWFYYQWHPNNIVAFVHEGFDRMLGEGTSNLIFKTLKLCYKIDEEMVISQPQLFEDKVRRISGDSADTVFETITGALRKEIAFNRITEA